MTILKRLVKFFFVFVITLGSSCSFNLIIPFNKKSVQKPSVSNKSLIVRNVRTTSYSHREKEKGGKYGALTASGRRLRHGKIRSAGADWSLYPLGTKFRIVGQPHTYIIEDYGRSLVGTKTIDIYKPTLRMMRSWGTRYVDIEVLEWGSFKASADILKGRLQYNHVKRMYDAIMAR